MFDIFNVPNRIVYSKRTEEDFQQVLGLVQQPKQLYLLLNQMYSLIKQRELIFAKRNLIPIKALRSADDNASLYKK